MTPVEGVEGRYRIDFDASWKVLYIFGGVTFATLVEAAIAHIGRADLSPVSAQATYIEPVLEGPAAVQIDVLRSGRRGAQVRASLWNAEDPATPGAAAVVMDLVLGVHDPAAVDVIDRYQSWRRFDSTLLALGMDGVNRLFSNDNPILRSARDLGMGVVGKLPGLRRAFIRQAAGIAGRPPRLLRGQPL